MIFSPLVTISKKKKRKYVGGVPTIVWRVNELAWLGSVVLSVRSLVQELSCAVGVAVKIEKKKRKESMMEIRNER